MRITLLVLSMVVILSFAVAACHDNNSNINSRNTFTEDQFVADPNLRANPETDTVIKFLEPPPTKVILANTRDTADLGVDAIKFTYNSTLEQTICWEDDDPNAEHFMTLEDAQGQKQMTVQANGLCETATLAPGEYTLNTTHDGLSDRTHTVFMIPNPDELLEASNQDGFFNKARSFAINAMNLITNKAIEDAHAQTSPLQTLISTRSCIGCDLRGVALNFRDLEGVDLTGAKLQSSDMTGSNFRQAELTSVNVKSADMTRANFTKADMTVVRNIDMASLTDTIFSGATWLDGACVCDVVGTSPNSSITVGNNPGASVYHPTNPTLYVTNVDDGTVSVIDTSTNTVTNTITVGVNPEQIVITPDGSTLYVVNENELEDTMASISVINTSTSQVTSTILAMDNPSDVAITPDGSTLYVLSKNGVILVFNTATNTVTETIFNVMATFLEITPDGRTLYGINLTGNNVVVIDTQTNMETQIINVGTLPANSVVSSRGFLYVPNFMDNSVSVIDTQTNMVTATINVGTRPTSASATPDGTYVFVTSSITETLDVVDTFTNTVIEQVQFGPQNLQPNNSTVSPDGTAVYVSNLESTTVSVVELASIGECSGCM